MQPLLRGGSLFPAANKKALTWDNSDHPARGSAEEGSGPGWLNGGGGGVGGPGGAARAALLLESHVNPGRSGALTIHLNTP